MQKADSKVAYICIKHTELEIMLLVYSQSSSTVVSEILVVVVLFVTIMSVVIMCSSTKYSYFPHRDWNFLGDGGSLRPKNL